MMKRLGRPLILVGLGALTVLVLLRLGNVDISMATLRRVELRYLLAAIAVHYSGFAVRGRRWQRLLDGLGHHLRYAYVTALLLAGWFVSALVPARAGDLARAYMLRRDHDVPMAQGFASLAAERALDIAAILALAGVSAVWALAGRTPPWVWQTIGGGVVLFAALAAALLVAPRLEEGLVSLLPWAVYRKAARFGFELLGSLRRLGRRPRLLATVAAQSLYIWLCDVLLMHLALRSIGVAAPLSVSAFTAMGVDLAAAVPIIPGALGQFEGTALGLLALFGIGAAQSSLVILLNRFISFWSFLAVSGAATYAFGFAQALQTEKLETEPLPSDG
ncbi:MAG: UPF0104 family protein [Caldilineae bacterium]|nr:MAG: UPF0104 family protein [Caldilineae bacterium]